MIEKLLGEPNWILSGWGDRSKKAYRVVLVEAVEASTQFRELFLASARLRKLDKAFIEKILDRSRELECSGAISNWQKISEEMQIAQEKKLEEEKLIFEAKRALPVPPRTLPSKLVCCVDVSTILDTLTVSIRFVRHRGIDRVYCDESPSLKEECETQGTIAEAVAKLLPGVLTTFIRFQGSIEFAGSGLVDEGQFANVVEELNIRLAKTRGDNLQQADIAIVKLARELGLRPEPSSKSSGFWDARCPGTQHGLLLNTGRNEFWCGYCNRSGDLDGLRSFVDDRNISSQITVERSRPDLPTPGL